MDVNLVPPGWLPEAWVAYLRDRASRGCGL